MNNFIGKILKIGVPKTIVTEFRINTLRLAIHTLRLENQINFVVCVFKFFKFYSVIIFFNIFWVILSFILLDNIAVLTPNILSADTVLNFEGFF